MAVAQFVLDRRQGELTSGYTIPVESPLETDTIEGEPCRFRTCYPVTLWPFELVSAELKGQPFSAPAVPYSSKSLAVLRLVFRCFAKTLNFSQLSLDKLRFYLHGQSQHVFPLYEMLFNNVLGVALADSPADREPALLRPNCLRQVGFERDEGMLPYPAAIVPGLPAA